MKGGEIINRLLNFIIVLLALIILLPLFVYIYIRIRLDSSGPAIFKQERVGKDGKPFIIYKFRTMKVDVDPNGQSPIDMNDSRITKVGKFLRETSLDELPQLFNVLKGDMNIVGPRPLLPWQAEKFNKYEAQRLKVKPGITGLAQVNGRGQLTWDEKIKYDIEYVNNRSLWLDLKIIYKTIINVIKKEDIYETKKGAWKDEEG